MLRIAVLGANGFIGSRVVEALHLRGLAEVVPIVRSFASLARVARFELDFQVADATDPVGLRQAFTGCDVVIHAIAGEPGVIVGTLDAPYRAAQAAGVRRLIYLSSASVHGQAPVVGTDETSPLRDRQTLAYNNAKVQAEWKLQALRKQGEVEVVILRPGIVFGPRATWVTGFADALLQGQAYLLDRGGGVCNSLYIDNLVDAIWLATEAPGVDGHAFLLGDSEQITWADFYRPLAHSLGVDLGELPEAEVPDFTPGWRERVQHLHRAKLVQAVLALFPRPLRQAAYDTLIASLRMPVSPWALPTPSRPVATEEMAALYRCQYKLPFEKAKVMLGYVPRIALDEAWARTLGWLAFAGYPVIQATQVMANKEDRMGELWIPTR